MTISQSLSFGMGRKLPVMLQVEAAECGQACLAMIAAYHGQVHDMHSLRHKLSPSMKGATLKQLMAMAGQLGLATRPLRLELEALAQLRLPCILHWEFNHFVVLKEVGPRAWCCTTRPGAYAS